MAANPRSLGHGFNPISVFWCFDDQGRQAGVVVEVHNTYGDRHAYLVHPDEQGRAQTEKAMYVSPFHGVDGTYDVAVPIPTDRLHVAVTLRGHDHPSRRRLVAVQRQPHRHPQRPPRPQDPRRRAARQRADPGPRHLAVGPPPADPPPTHPPSGGRPMTLEKNRPDPPRRPEPEPGRARARAAAPAVPAPRSPRPSPRRLFRAAVSRLAVTVVEEPTGRRLGQGGPTMRLHRPDEFYARLGRDGLIGFGEAYLTGAWDAEDLAGFLTVPAARIATLIPELAAAAARLRHARACPATSAAPRPTARPTSRTTTTCPTTSSRSSSTRRSAIPPPSSTPPPPRPGRAPAPSVTTWSPPHRSPPTTRDPLLHGPDFAEAQGRKIERLLDEAGVTDGTRVLEIGTGWGELAIRAARRGATVHSITLSVEQLELAEERDRRRRLRRPGHGRADGLPRARRPPARRTTPCCRSR